MNVLNQEISEKYAMYHGDCCEVVKGIPDNSVGYIIFSPPFSSLYTYSNYNEDMGNSGNDDEFYQHFKFLIPELYRVLKAGRSLSFHCMDLPTSKERDGFIGLRDFPGELLRLFEDAGFIFHSRVTIWKDPLIAATRTKALGLLHKQIVKDSYICRQGIADYLITVRKRGENQEPIAHPHGLTEYYGENEPQIPKSNIKYSHMVWRQYASPVWDDIRQTYTLNTQGAKDQNDEKHICLAKGSLILTKDGFKPIENIGIGDMVLTHTGSWKPVIAKACTGMNRVIQTKAQGVANLITTPTHKLWARKSVWKRCKDGMKREMPKWIESQNCGGGYVNLKLPVIEESALTEREWWIIGRYLADGSVGTRGDFFISVGHKKIAEFEQKADSYFGMFSEGTARQYRLLTKQMPKEMIEILKKCGRRAENKQVPYEGLCLCKEKAEALLSGYLSGDGNTTGNATTATSVSRALLLGMAMIAQRAREVIASVFAGKKAGKHVIDGRVVNAKQTWVMGWRESTHHHEGIILEDGAWKKVGNPKDAGIAETWSIQVADDASYTAEGCIVKNCPLQLDVIARGITLWSNKNDVVLSPFGGIASEGYQAIKMGRKFIGIELKDSYYNQAVLNLKKASELTTDISLF